MIVREHLVDELICETVGTERMPEAPVGLAVRNQE
jgi:hypothetical protein